MVECSFTKSVVFGSGPVAEWSDDESNAVDNVDIVILTPDNVDSLRNDKKSK